MPPQRSNRFDDVFTYQTTGTQESRLPSKHVCWIRDMHEHQSSCYGVKWTAWRRVMNVSFDEPHIPYSESCDLLPGVWSVDEAGQAWHGAPSCPFSQGGQACKGGPQSNISCLRLSFPGCTLPPQVVGVGRVVVEVAGVVGGSVEGGEVAGGSVVGGATVVVGTVAVDGTVVVVGRVVVVGTVVVVGRVVVVGMVVVVGTVVVDGVTVFDPLVTASTMMITAIMTTAATPMAIQMARWLFRGRYWSVHACPSQNRSTCADPPGSGYHPAGWGGPGGCLGWPTRVWAVQDVPSQ
jgi:hypothetical protein